MRLARVFQISLVPDLQGRPLLTSDLRGKVVLVDFWATWCPPCKKEMPGYQKLADRYGTGGFAMIGFKFDTMPDIEDPLQFAERVGVHYPLVVATDDVKRKFGGIEGLPTTMLYDRNGILRGSRGIRVHRQCGVGFEATALITGFS